MTQFVDVSEAMSDCRIHRDEASGLMVLDVSAQNLWQIIYRRLKSPTGLSGNTLVR